MQSMRAFLSECIVFYLAEVAAKFPVRIAALQPLAVCPFQTHVPVDTAFPVSLTGTDGTSLLANLPGGCGSARLSVNNSLTKLTPTQQTDERTPCRI